MNLWRLMIFEITSLSMICVLLHRAKFPSNHVPRTVMISVFNSAFGKFSYYTSSAPLWICIFQYVFPASPLTSSGGLSLFTESRCGTSLVCLMSTNLSPSRFLHSLFLSVSLLLSLSAAPGWIKDAHTHTHSVNKHIKMPNKTALNSSGGREAGRKRRMNRKARAVGHQIRRQSRGGKTELFRGVHVNEFEQSPLMMSLHSQRQSKARWYWAACSMHYCAHKMFINERTPALRFFTHQREVKSSLYIVILWFRLFFHIRNIHSLHGV